MSTNHSDLIWQNTLNRIRLAGVVELHADDTRLPRHLRGAESWLVIRPTATRPGGHVVAFGVVSEHQRRREATEAAAHGALSASAQGGFSLDRIAHVAAPAMTTWTVSDDVGGRWPETITAPDASAALDAAEQRVRSQRAAYEGASEVRVTVADDEGSESRTVTL